MCAEKQGARQRPPKRKRPLDADSRDSSSNDSISVAGNRNLLGVPTDRLKRNVRMTVVIRRLLRPRPEKFNSYAVFIGVYQVDQCYDGPEKTMWLENVFAGEIFSYHRYYVYDCLCTWTDTIEEPMYRIKRIFKVTRVDFGIPVVKMICAELKLAELTTEIIVRELTTLPGNLSGPAFEDAMKSRFPTTYETIKKAHYFTAYDRMRVAQIFPNNATRLQNVNATEILDKLQANPYGVVLDGIDEWETSVPNIDAIEATMPQLKDAISALQILRVISDYRKDSGSCVFSLNQIRPLLLPRYNQQFDQGFQKLLADHIVRQSEVATNYYFLGIDYLLIKRLMACLLRVAQNHYNMKIKGEDPITQERLQRYLDNPRFNTGQKRGFQHIKDQPFTLFDGNGGVGKTEIVAEAVNGLLDRKCVVGTFISYHAARLKKERIGIGCTMHSIVADLKRVRAGKKSNMGKALNVSALFIDEIANLSMDIFVDVLEALITKPGINRQKRIPLTRIIATGDPEQIPPIGVGCIGADFMKYMEEYVVHLTENMRVDADSKILVDLDNKLLADIDIIPLFKQSLAEKSPLTLLEPEKFEELLPQIVQKQNIRHFIFLGLEKVDVSYVSQTVHRLVQSGVAHLRRPGVLLERGSRVMIVDKFFPRQKVCEDVVSDELHNGQYFTVDRIVAGETHSKSNYDLDVVMRSVEPAIGTYIQVQTLEGVNFCIGGPYVDPRYIIPTYSATVNKLQGGESDYVVCYLPRGIGKKRCWNRSHLHVILSRPRKAIYLFADVTDVRAIAARKLPHRLTGVDVAIKQLLPVIRDKDKCLAYEDSTLPIKI